MANEQDVTRLIDMLYEKVEDAKAPALKPNMSMVDRDEILDLLDELRAQLPVELRRAKELLAAREKFVEDAKRDVDRMMRQAELEAKSKVSESEILSAAREKSRGMIAHAEERCRRMYQVTNEYTEDALARAEEAMQMALDEVKQSRVNFRSASAAKMQEQRAKMNGTDELQFLDSYAKIDALLERVASVRESCGKDFGIAIDFHGRVHKPMAKIVAKKLEEFDPMFIEEPVLCDNMEYFPEIAAACNIPIATGERLFTKYDFKRLLAIGGVDIVQPDLSHAGGLTECKKIAAMAEAHDVALAPHCPLGPVALASCLNLDATCYNAAIQEQSIGIHYNEGRSVLDYALNPEDFKFVNGFVSLPQKPGLGVEVNKALVEEEGETPHSWKNPVWRHEDGSVAEW